MKYFVLLKCICEQGAPDSGVAGVPGDKGGADEPHH